jgi:hypothetical protein
MLSFMQDPNSNDSMLNAPGAGPAGQESNENQNDAEDYLTPPEHARNVRRSTIILVILFTCGVLCIWFMIKQTTPKTASATTSAEETQIENAIEQLTGIKTQMHSRIGQMLDKFYQFADVDQVGVSKLKKNPFRHELYLPDFEGFLDDARKNSNIGTGNNLQLWSIMETQQGSCCMINDKILYEGHSIRGFKVIKITEKSVELMSNGARVILKMAE